jgi:transcriptional regulator with XRE-family HTH domain
MLSAYLNTVLKQLRQMHGLTQQNVADVLGITKTEYWRMEQENFLPNPLRIHLLAYFYNVSLDVLYGMQVDHQYKKLQEDVVKYYNKYEVISGNYIDGNLTLAENTLAVCQISFRNDADADDELDRDKVFNFTASSYGDTYSELSGILGQIAGK